MSFDMSMDGCKYYLTISFSSTQTVLCINKLHLRTQKCCILYYKCYKISLSGIKLKAFTFKHGLK